jgi:ubiquinone/menaquinone biosynthesis C-methylase UbiE/DNA-binding transcriptional ArsR family regulator
MFKGSVASQDVDEVVRALKSAGEPTRLRLLFLLSQAEYTVGELCEVLGQSQPRISRHLRLLTEAGLLDRFREQQCVYYRAPVSGRYLEWLRRVLSMADPDAPVLRLDRERATRVVRDRARLAARQLAPEVTSSGTREDLTNVLLELLGPASVGELLDIGTGSGLMMEILGTRARHAVGVDISVPALRVARTRVHGAGLAHCEFRCGDMYRLPFDDASFDTVTIERVLASADRPVAALAEAARMLRPDGRLIVIEGFDQIDVRGSDNPLSQLRRWFAEAGMKAGRLRPSDLAGQHYIVAFAHRGSEALSAPQPQHAEGRA